jgi:hypothetical protein
MQKPRILALYYSQSGQLRDIIDSILSEVLDELDITYAPIEPEQEWPFPWKTNTFFDAMPECVEQKPASVKPLPDSIRNTGYDLVILGWQPWFLHPSQPIAAFLQSEDAEMLRGKPVVTVVGCRNMWLNAGEKIKEHLLRIGANHAGNIVLTDTNPNLVSLLTIIRWAFSGKKEASRWLPAAGVQERDVKAAARFGKPILEAANALAGAQQGTAADLHQKLLAQGAIQLNTGLVLLEQRGIKNFRFWAKYIREKGGPGAPERQKRVTMFKRLLITAVFVLSPISSLTAFIQRKLQHRRLLKDVAYFKELAYEPGRI